MSAIEAIQGDVIDTYQTWEAAVREFWALPHSGNGVRDSEAKGALYGFAMANFGWNKVKTRDDIRRIFQVIHHERVAGTKADRKKVAAALEKAEAVVKKRKPEIESAIRELQKELGGLTQERDRLNAQSVEANTAAQALVALAILPRCVVSEIARVQRAAADLEDGGTRAIVQEIETEIFELETIITGPVADPNVPHSDETKVERFANWLIQTGYGVEHVEIIEHQDDNGRTRTEKKLVALGILQQESRERLPELRKQLEAAKESHQDHEAEIQKLTQYYIK